MRILRQTVNTHLLFSGGQVHFEHLSLSGFRSFLGAEVAFRPGLNVFVGENGVGKSSVGTGLERLLTGEWTGADQPHGGQVPWNLSGTILLSNQETLDWPAVRALQAVPQLKNASPVHAWASQQSRLDLVSRWAGGNDSNERFVRWGGLTWRNQVAETGNATESLKKQPFIDLLLHPEFPQLLTQVGPIRLTSVPFDLAPQAGAFLHQRFRRFADFRQRPATKPRTGAVDALGGEDTAVALMTLRIHSQPAEQARYTAVKANFEAMFPRFQIDVVESRPGSNTPTINFYFYEQGRDRPLPMEQISAGPNEVLTLLTNLSAREGFVFFVEHPEQHLHPHASRMMLRLLHESAERNQIILTTHSPYFVDGTLARSIHRVSWAFTTGSQAWRVDDGSDDKAIGQIQTALRNVDKREMLFSRAVILVEDETQREFLKGVAPTLGCDLDALGVSVIEVGGHDGFKAYEAFLASLHVPYVCLRDKVWGELNRFPLDRYFAFGMEIEDYLDANGLKAKRMDVKGRVGTSKQRVASTLAAELEETDIPEVFRGVLDAAQNIALSGVTGHHGASA